MKVRPIRRFIYRQLILPEEYQQKLIRVKQIIQEFTTYKPTSETTLMCLIDEFLNIHDGSSINQDQANVESGRDASQPHYQS